MQVLILGGCGFIGQHIAATLQNHGYSVISTTRSGQHTHVPVNGFAQSSWRYTFWDGCSPHILTPLLAECDVIINLIGENIGQKRWTKRRKKEITHSRLKATQALSTALHYMYEEKIPLPRQLIQASACGYYGLWDDYLSAPFCTEKTLAFSDAVQSPHQKHGLGSGFLARVCTQWEEASIPIANLGIHTCTLRFAPVLGRAWHKKTIINPQAALPTSLCSSTPLAGLLRSMIPPFRYYMGGVIGSGNQPMSWIHIDDVSQSVLHALMHTSEGVYNVCSPYPESMQNFITLIGKQLQKPTFFRIPSFMTRLLLGEMAEELILKGQKCVPQRLLNENFVFQHAKLSSALEACFCRDTREKYGITQGVRV